MPSVQSLLIQPCRDGDSVALGTSFVVQNAEGSYLITNRHNVTGRDSENRPLKQFSVMPDSLRIHHNREGQLGHWKAVQEPLYLGAGQPRWLEHPVHGRRVDVVALKLTQLDGVALFPYDPTGIDKSDVAVPITTDLNIVGFPFGITGGGLLGVWSRGTVATEPDIDFDSLPLMLIDSRTRQGQSGSPVIFHSSGRAVATKSGGSAMYGGPVTFLVGIYSGRVSEESDLGLVWKARVISEIIQGGKSPTGESLMPE
jgi:hypothetical protein